MSKGKRYTEEFKNEAVKQITERGYSVTEVADRLGVCTKTLYQWRSDLPCSPKELKSTDDQAEIVRLKSELIRVTEERDILKKAAVGCNWSAQH
jgi:transposase